MRHHEATAGLQRFSVDSGLQCSRQGMKALILLGPFFLMGNDNRVLCFGRWTSVFISVPAPVVQVADMLLDHWLLCGPDLMQHSDTFGKHLDDDKFHCCVDGDSLMGNSTCDLTWRWIMVLWELQLDSDSFEQVINTLTCSWGESTMVGFLLKEIKRIHSFLWWILIYGSINALTFSGHYNFLII